VAVRLWLSRGAIFGLLRFLGGSIWRLESEICFNALDGGHWVGNNAVLMRSFIITHNILEGSSAADDSNLKLIFWSTS
jgi:hypothetical protein